MIVARLEPIDVAEVVDVFVDAFRDYPVMRFVLGADDPAYARRLPVLITLFVRARVVRGDAVFGARDEAGRLVGVATTAAPGERAAPPSFASEREATWREFGPAARARYDAFAAASDRHPPGTPHLYLNMLGVRRALAGQGIGRRLLDVVHAHSRAEPGSTGVALSTEDPAIVALYEHVGYRVLGRAHVAQEFETWALWRPDEA